MSALSAVSVAALVSGCSDATSEEGIDLTAEALAAAAASGCTPKSVKGSQLHIYTWSDYISPDVQRSFEEALGVTIVIDTFESNEAMYAKLKAGGSGYDIIMPTSYQIATMAKEGMIDKLDHSRIPNVRKNFDKAFTSQIIDPTFEYNVPYAVTYTGLAILTNKVPAGVDVSSWAVLGESAFSGRVTLLDDIREVIGAGLMYLGYSINSTNPKEIDAAVEQILKWRKNVRKFDGESYKTEVPGGSTWVGHGYSTDVYQVIVGDEEAGAPPRNDVVFVLPKEGYAIAFDEMVVSSKAKNKALAYAFMNYIYEGKVAAVNMEYICGPNPVKPGLDLLDPEYRSIIIVPEDKLALGQVLKGFDGKPEVMELYNKAWDKIKATEAK
jgi:spermidine/putrescine transport system substrate-binding protein